MRATSPPTSSARSSAAATSGTAQRGTRRSGNGLRQRKQNPETDVPTKLHWGHLIRSCARSTAVLVAFGVRNRF